MAIKLLAIITFVILIESSILLSIKYQSKITQALNPYITRGICANITNKSKQIQCFENNLDEYLLKNDLTSAFEIIARLYSENQTFADNCHSFMHKVGEKAYQLFKSKEDFKLPSNTSHCGYGFYHGFIETLLTKGGSLDEASSFCNWAQAQTGKNTDAKGACFHGIGHGISENHDKKVWKNEAELVEPGLVFCQKVAPDELMLDRCASGIFNVLAIKYPSGQVPFNKQDPLNYCSTLTSHYFKKPCYEEMNTALMSLTGNNFAQAAKFTKNIKDDNYARITLRSLALVAGAKLEPSNFSEAITICRTFQNRLHTPCIRGLVGGMIEKGLPNSQHINSMKFCSNILLKEDERSECYKEALWLLSVYLSKEKYYQTCKKVDENYRKFCNS